MSDAECCGYCLTQEELMGQEDWLRQMSDDELDLLVQELEGRAEQFEQKTRTLVNDELRRRGKPLIGFGRSRM